MRLVLDTNIVASGLLWDGSPAQLFDAAQAHEIELYTSRVLLAELTRADAPAPTLSGVRRITAPYAVGGSRASALLASEASRTRPISPATAAAC